MISGGSIHNMSDRIRWILWSRVVFLGVMATSAICLNFVYGDTIQKPVLWAILLGLSFSFVSRLILYMRPFKNKLLVLAYAQILADAFLTSFLVKETGGINSAFIILYGLNILSGGILVMTRGALVGLASSLIGYTSVVLQSEGLYIGLNPQLLTRFILVFSVLTLVGGLAALLFKSRDHLLKSLERTSSDLIQLIEIQSAIVGHIPSGLLILDPSGTIIFSSPSAKRILDSDYTGENFRKLPFDPWISKVREFHIEREPGKPLSLYVEKVSLDSGKLLIVITDISDVKRLENEIRVREKLAGVGQLAAGLAHEIKNPLASLSGSIQLLQKEEQASEAKDKLMNIILRETDRLDELLNGFLNYAKPSQIQWQETLLNSCIEEVCKLLQAQEDVQSKRIDFKFELENKVMCVCDPGKIKQVIWNLARNAISALEEGGQVFIRLKRTDDFIRFEIEDTGEGIPEEIQERIFEPFFSKRPQGTGLGLALVYQIIEAHGGRIGFKSKPGSGSLFWFELNRKGRIQERSAA